MNARLHWFHRPSEDDAAPAAPRHAAPTRGHRPPRPQRHRVTLVGQTDRPVLSDRDVLGQLAVDLTADLAGDLAALTRVLLDVATEAPVPAPAPVLVSVPDPVVPVVATPAGWDSAVVPAMVLAANLDPAELRPESDAEPEPEPEPAPEPEPEAAVEPELPAGPRAAALLRDLSFLD